LDRRIKKTITPDVGPAEVEQFAYDGPRIVLRWANGNLAHRYLHGPAVDQILADEQLDEATGQLDHLYWPLTDNLGTVRDIVEFDPMLGYTDIVNHIAYDAYGRITSETNAAVDTIFGYTGRETDAESDLNYYRARYYDPAVGRFASEDPLGFAAGDVNLYRYVGNGPTNATDPSGMDEFDDNLAPNSKYTYFWEFPAGRMEVRFKGTRVKKTYDKQKDKYVALPAKPWTFLENDRGHANVEVSFVPNDKSPCDTSRIKFIQIAMTSSVPTSGYLGGRRIYNRRFPTKADAEKHPVDKSNQIWRLNDLLLKGNAPWFLDIFPGTGEPFYLGMRTFSNEDEVYMEDTPGMEYDFGGRDPHFEFQTYAVCQDADGKLTFLGGMRWSIEELQVFSWVWRLLGGYDESHGAWRPLKRPSEISRPTQEVKDILDLFNHEFKRHPPWKF